MDALIIVIVANILFTGQRALGADHTVQGWELTGHNVSGYRRSKMAFAVGDGLVFTFGGGEADIAEVSRSDFKVCSAEASQAIYRANTTEVIYLNKTGNWYFISRVPEHCKSGKKLLITVVANKTRNNNGNDGTEGFIFRGRSPRMGFGGVAKVAAMATAAVPSQKDIPLVEGDAITPRHGFLMGTSSFGL